MVFLIFFFFFHLKSRSKEYLIVFKDTPAIFFFFSQVQNEEHTLCQSFYYLDSNPNKIFLKALQSINHTARRKILRSRIRNSAIQRKVPRFKYNFLDASQTLSFRGRCAINYLQNPTISRFKMKISSFGDVRSSARVA